LLLLLVLLLQIQGSSSTAGAATTRVPLTTVDAMMRSLQLQRLFMLKIDTEGFDPLVLRGARKSLAEHKVDLLLFEYNDGGVWGADGLTLKVGSCIMRGRTRLHSTCSVQTVTSELESFGYICYFKQSCSQLLATMCL
jgi:hypothetical protein